MDCAWEDLALSEDSEAVGESGHVVLSSLVNSLKGFVALYSGLISQNIVRKRSVIRCLTLRGTVGSYLATEYAVVLVSTVLKILERMPGLEPNSLL